MGFDKDAILWEWPIAMINVFEHCQLYSQGVKLAGFSNTNKVIEAALKLKQEVMKCLQR